MNQHSYLNVWHLEIERGEHCMLHTNEKFYTVNRYFHFTSIHSHFALNKQNGFFKTAQNQIHQSFKQLNTFKYNLSMP